MRRYKQYGSELTQDNGKKRYSTFYYKPVIRRDSDLYVTAKKSDRLDLLASQYYNDPTLWFIIHVANNLPGGTFRVEPGTILRIPYPLDSTDLEQYFETT